MMALGIMPSYGIDAIGGQGERVNDNERDKWLKAKKNTRDICKKEML